jgi:pilus assembly protein FimV
MHFVRCALALMLVLASNTAAALGLGEIVVRSRLDQPLLAEIPIISSDPSELEQLQARLASPETFTRIGLEPPQGVVSDLRFMVALDNAGNPVVRVTSSQPVDQPLLTFLVEVDWGQGRLVREYSALLDAPRTVSAPLQPPIEAPVVAQPNTIIREPVAPEPIDTSDSVADSLEDSLDDQALAAAPEDGVAPPAEGTAPSNEIAVAPARPAAPAPVARPARRIEGDSYEVRRGDTLSGIATRLQGARGVSLNQAMIAMLQANPDAFIDGNVNLVKAGAVLRVPDADALTAIDAAEANVLVRTQTRQWRQGNTALPQPAMTGSVGQGTNDQVSEQASAPASGSVADARLEIVPPGASDAARAGNQSGISAGGEGEMLRQDMQQTQETLAARDAELAEMKARLSELEAIQKQQQQLIELKDSELAAAQQQLAQSGGPMSVMPWVLGGAGLLLIALLGAWIMRRRTPVPVFRAPDSVPRKPSVADAFAASPMGGPVAACSDDEVAEADAIGGELEEIDAVEIDRADEAATASSQIAEATSDEAADEPVEQVVDPRMSPETAAGPGPSSDALHDMIRPASEQPAAPAWHDTSTARSAATKEGGASNERLELARAYIALGDRDSARQLLGEVRVHGDLASRQQATQLLRDLE